MIIDVITDEREQMYHLKVILEYWLHDIVGQTLLIFLKLSIKKN